MDSYRYYEIDLLRFLAALSVILFHYTYRGWVSDDMSVLVFSELGGYFKYGYLGVNLFFMISGFVILLSAYNKGCVAFVISRVIRLYPGYWAAVTLTAICALIIGGERYTVDAYQYLLNLTMLHKIFDIKSIDGVYWSLIVELKFYLLIFLLILFKQIRNIMPWLAVWLVVSIFISHYGHVKYMGVILFPEWSGYFIAGATFFLIRKDGLKSVHIMVLICSCYLVIRNALLNQQDGIDYVVLLILISFFVIFSIITRGSSAILNKPLFAYLGVLTYPLYLIHQNIGFMIFNGLGGIVNKYVLLVVVSLFMLLLAYLVNFYVEKRYSPRFKAVLESGVGRLGF